MKAKSTQQNNAPKIFIKLSISLLSIFIKKKKKKLFLGQTFASWRDTFLKYTSSHLSSRHNSLKVQMAIIVHHQRQHSS